MINCYYEGILSQLTRMITPSTINMKLLLTQAISHNFQLTEQLGYLLVLDYIDTLYLRHAITFKKNVFFFKSLLIQCYKSRI